MSKKIQQIAAFSFGVVFISVLLAIAVFFPHPTAFQYMVFKTVLALSMAGVAAMIPGFVDVNISTWLRAGGALAVLVIAYFYNPAELVTQSPEKTEPELSIVDHSLAYGGRNNQDAPFVLAPQLEVTFLNTGDAVAVLNRVTCAVEEEAVFDGCSNQMVQASQEYEKALAEAAEWEKTLLAEQKMEEERKWIEEQTELTKKLQQANKENQYVLDMLKQAQEAGDGLLAAYLVKIKYIPAPRLESEGFIKIAQEAADSGDQNVVARIITPLAENDFGNPEPLLVAMGMALDHLPDEAAPGAGPVTAAAADPERNPGRKPSGGRPGIISEVNLELGGEARINRDIAGDSSASVKISLGRSAGGVAPSLYRVKLGFSYGSGKVVEMEPFFIKMSGVSGSKVPGISEELWDMCAAEASDAFSALGYNQ